MDNFSREAAVTHLKESIALADQMLALAEIGVGGCQDDGCLVVYGIMRDCAYKIRGSAEKELQEHEKPRVAETRSR